MRTLIFANGPISDPQSVPSLLRSDDRLIAADGGARHCLALGLKPDVVIGDFDSLSEAELEILRKSGSKMVRHPRAKDQTDLELALRHALKDGTTDILVFGGVGDRWDQTLANLLLPALPDLAEVSIWLVDGPNRATVLRSGGSLHLEGHPGDIVSLVPIDGSADGVITEGLEYPLHGETIAFGSTLGISNTMLAKMASVSLENGMLAVFIAQRMDESNR